MLLIYLLIFCTFILSIVLTSHLVRPVFSLLLLWCRCLRPLSLFLWSLLLRFRPPFLSPLLPFLWLRLSLVLLCLSFAVQWLRLLLLSSLLRLRLSLTLWVFDLSSLRLLLLYSLLRGFLRCLRIVLRSWVFLRFRIFRVCLRVRLLSFAPLSLLRLLLLLLCLRLLLFLCPPLVLLPLPLLSFLRLQPLILRLRLVLLLRMSYRRILLLMRPPDPDTLT